MSTLSFHPLAEVFPLMQGPEFDEFTASIKNNGLRDPIILHDGMILDGRNRYRACLIAGIEPRTEAFNGGGNPALFVLDRNCHRRHLTESQRAMAVAKLASLGAGQPKKYSELIPNTLTQEQAAKIARVSSKTIGNAREILNHGTPEEINEVINNKAAVTPMADFVRARRKGKPLPTRSPQKKGPPRGPQLKTLVREFERRIELLCTNCEHIEDIEIPKLTQTQKEKAVHSVKEARLILSRFINRLGENDA